MNMALMAGASGLKAHQNMLDVIGDNIANAATPGYKKDSLFLKELDAATRSQIKTKSDWQTPMIDQVYTDFSQGSLRRTDNLFDVAIEGQGFFTVESPEGAQRPPTDEQAQRLADADDSQVLSLDDESIAPKEPQEEGLLPSLLTIISV